MSLITIFGLMILLNVSSLAVSFPWWTWTLVVVLIGLNFALRLIVEANK